MSVRVSNNTALVSAQVDTGIALALRYMLDAIDTTAFPRTPKNIGNLRANVLKQVLGKKGVIEWRKDYAVFQETKQFKHYTTPGTGPHYAEDSVKKVVKDSDTYFKKAGVI